MGGLGGAAPQTLVERGPSRAPADLQGELRSLPVAGAGGAELLAVSQVHAGQRSAGRGAPGAEARRPGQYAARQGARAPGAQGGSRGAEGRPAPVPGREGVCQLRRLRASRRTRGISATARPCGAGRARGAGARGSGRCSRIGDGRWNNAGRRGGSRGRPGSRPSTGSWCGARASAVWSSARSDASSSSAVHSAPWPSGSWGCDLRTSRAAPTGSRWGFRCRFAVITSGGRSRAV